MIRSSRTSLRFANEGKIDKLDLFLNEYFRVEQAYVGILWKAKMEDARFSVPSLLPKDMTEKVETWISARARQCAGKQASGVVRGTFPSLIKMEYKHKMLVQKGCHRKARKLQTKIERLRTEGPTLNKFAAELDGRFVEISAKKETVFDMWLDLSSLGDKLKISIPLRKTRHFNNLSVKGEIKDGVRISKDGVTFMFDIKEPDKKIEGKVVGVDIGIKAVVSLSDGFQSGKDKHGWDLDGIQDRISRREKGGKGFERTQAHRKNHINWCLNQVDLSDIKRINIEKLKNMRRGKGTSRKLSHWTYTLIFDKLNRLAEEHGVRAVEVDPAYKSRRCAKCGWVCEGNRKGRNFKCRRCGHAADADLNASVNIALDLPLTGKEEQRLYHSGEGFLWTTVGQESIVPVT